jgi:hypothetical protein
MGFLDKFFAKKEEVPPVQVITEEKELSENELEDVTNNMSREEWLHQQIAKQMQRKTAPGATPEIINECDYLIGKYTEELEHPVGRSR